MSIISWFRDHERVSSTIYVLFLGQVISFVMSLIGFSSSLVAELGVDTPVTLTFFSYLALALVYGSILVYRRRKLLVPWYWYFPLGFVDVQGNYFVNKAFQYSSITSVSLLDCWTIVWVIILTRIFLGTRYSLWQFVGAAICILGLGLVLLSDAGVGGGGGSKPLLGDLLVITGTFFYAFSNVGEEFCVKKKDRVEVVAMLSLFAMLVSIVQIALLEWKSLQSVEWSTDIILCFVGYATGSFIFYTLTPLVLQMSGATLFNLSILTSDMWAVVIRIFIYRQKVDWLYYVSFAIVGVGIIIYSKTERKSDLPPSMENGNLTNEYQLLRDENTNHTENGNLTTEYQLLHDESSNHAENENLTTEYQLLRDENTKS
ncbi:solute carrier family 35 member F1-like [Impatiens glandulifera]|uniref:solute carrier family 35 member F1-like n=1 Tax=Impatiens glandulifera TaxID=253017 RepID=UPI001FB0D063|nr:solute carrier family 35 member F1-like [Impatiens glandulifera]